MENIMTYESQRGQLSYLPDKSFSWHGENLKKKKKQCQLFKVFLVKSNTHTLPTPTHTPYPYTHPQQQQQKPTKCYSNSL